MHQQLLLILILYGTKLNAQPVHVPIKRAFPVVSSYSKYIHDPFSAIENQAQLGAIKQPAVGIYNERKFMLKELSLLQCGFVFPHRSGGLGLNLVRTGNRFFNETSVGLGFGRKLNDILLLGIQFNYLHAKAASGVSLSTVGFESGVLVQLTENIKTGFHISNLSVVSADNSEKGGVVYSFGLGYDVSESLLLTASLEKQANLSSNMLVAMRYAFLPAFYVVAATVMGLKQAFMSFGLVWENKKLEFAGGYHNQLGFTPALTVCFSFAKPANE